MIRGSIWKFGNDIDTDQIIPSQYLLLPTIEEMKHYTFEPLDKEFPKKVQPGDILVGGENFGSGSSREQAPRVLKELGISAVIAKSFARIFFRNAINIGLPVIICRDLYEDVDEQDILEVEVEQGLVRTIKNNREYTCTQLPEHIREILAAKGLIEFINQKV